jgi:hypothetical protein
MALILFFIAGGQFMLGTLFLTAGAGCIAVVEELGLECYVRPQGTMNSSQ